MSNDNVNCCCYWYSHCCRHHHTTTPPPPAPSIHQSIYVWFCICSSCWQYMSDFQYHDCHGPNAKRSVDSLKQQNHSGILGARYPRIYKEIIIYVPDTNLKAKPNSNTLRFRLNRYHVRVIDDWLENINDNQTTGVCLFDISKYFNTINHPILLRKLSMYDIKQTELEWFSC